MKDHVHNVEAIAALSSNAVAPSVNLNEANVEKNAVLDANNTPSSSNAAVAKLVKIWENNNAQRALRGGALSTMALTLAACGGGSSSTSSTTTTTPDPVNTTLDADTAPYDDYTGGAGDDVITANHLTLQANDQIDGAGGTADKLDIANTSASAWSVTPAVMTNVEIVELTSTGAGSGTINLSTSTGVLSVVSKDSTANDIFQDMQTAIVTTVDGSSNSVTATYNATLAGATKSASVIVTGGADMGTLTVSGSDGTVSSASSTKFGTLNLASNGSSANAIDVLDADYAHTSNAFTTVNVTGAADLTLGTGTAFASGDVLVVTLNAAAFTGDLTAYVDAGTTTSVTGGTGADTIYLDGAETFFAASNTTATTIAGGAGDDTLVIDESLVASQLVTSDATVANNTLSSIENLKLVLSGGATTNLSDTIDASVASSIEDVIVEITNADATADGTDTTVTATVTNIKAQTISATGTASATDTDSKVALALTKYDGSATDSAQAATLAGAFKTVTFNDASDDSDTSGVDESGAVEVISIAAGASNLSIDSLVAAGAFTATFTGSKNVTVTAANLGGTNTSNTSTADDLVTINAGSLTGNLDFTKSEAGVYSITAGTGTNAIRLGELADNTTVTGGSGTDTVYATDTTGSAEINITTTGVETLVLDTTSSGTDTFNLANVTASTVKLVDAANGAGFGITLSEIGSQTIDVVTSEATVTGTTGNDTNDVDWASGETITLGLATGTSGASVKLSGNAQESATLSSYDATLKTNGTLTVDSQIQTTAGAYLDTNLELEGTSSSSLLTGLILNGGGAQTSSTVAEVVIGLDSNDNVSLTSLNASSFTGDLDVSNTGIFNRTDGATLTTSTGDSVVTTNTSDLTNGVVHFNDLGGTDTLAFTGTSVALGVINVDGFETLDLSDVDTTGAVSMNLRDSLDVTTLRITAPTDGDLDDNVTISNAASNFTLALQAAYGNGADTITVTANGTGTSDAITLTTDGGNFTSGHADAAVTFSGYETVNILAGADDINLGSNDALLTLTGATRLNVGGDIAATDDGDITLGTVAATSAATVALTTVGGSVTIGDLGTMNSLETFTLTSATGETITVNGGSSSSLDTITITGAGASAITAFTGSSLDTVSAGTATGNVTLGSASAALTYAAGATVTTGEGDDVITMALSNIITITAGEKTGDDDNLILVGAQNGATGIIDLSASGDQLTTYNGTAETVVQSGFEDVDLSAVTSTGSYGFTITANAAGSTIVGSNYADTITGGAGADIITADGGADTINLTVDGVSDTIKIAFGGDGTDTITNFLAGTGGDVLDFTGSSDVVNTLSPGFSADAANTETVNGAAGLTADHGLTIFDNEDTTEAVADLTAMTVTAAAARLNDLSDDTDNHAFVLADDSDDVYVILGTATDAGLFKVTGDASNVVISKEDLTLIAIFEGISDTGTLTHANFADFGAT